MKSIWSLLPAFCSPPGSSCAIKSRRVSGERDSALPGLTRLPMRARNQAAWYPSGEPIFPD